MFVPKSLPLTHSLTHHSSLLLPDNPLPVNMVVSASSVSASLARRPAGCVTTQARWDAPITSRACAGSSSLPRPPSAPRCHHWAAGTSLLRPPRQAEMSPPAAGPRRSQPKTRQPPSPTPPLPQHLLVPFTRDRDAADSVAVKLHMALFKRRGQAAHRMRDLAQNFNGFETDDVRHGEGRAPGGQHLARSVCAAA